MKFDQYQKVECKKNLTAEFWILLNFKDYVYKKKHSLIFTD